MSLVLLKQFKTFVDGRGVGTKIDNSRGFDSCALGIFARQVLNEGDYYRACEEILTTIHQMKTPLSTKMHINLGSMFTDRESGVYPYKTYGRLQKDLAKLVAEMEKVS